jgi:hypothetical protein
VFAKPSNTCKFVWVALLFFWIALQILRGNIISWFFPDNLVTSTDHHTSLASGQPMQTLQLNTRLSNKSWVWWHLVVRLSSSLTNAQLTAARRRLGRGRSFCRSTSAISCLPFFSLLIQHLRSTKVLQKMISMPTCNVTNTLASATPSTSSSMNSPQPHRISNCEMLVISW